MKKRELKKGGKENRDQRREVRVCKPPGPQQPHLHGNAWPLPPSWRRVEVTVVICARSVWLIMWGMKWNSQGVHLFCVDYPSAAKRLSIYRNEMKERERGRQNKISTGAISPITSLPPSVPPCGRVYFSVVWFSRSLKVTFKWVSSEGWGSHWPQAAASLALFPIWDERLIKIHTWAILNLHQWIVLIRINLNYFILINHYSD